MLAAPYTTREGLKKMLKCGCLLFTLPSFQSPLAMPFDGVILNDGTRVRLPVHPMFCPGAQSSALAFGTGRGLKGSVSPGIPRLPSPFH